MNTSDMIRKINATIITNLLLNPNFEKINMNPIVVMIENNG